MKPPNSGHFGDSDYVRSREVVVGTQTEKGKTPRTVSMNIIRPHGTYYY